MRPSAWWLRLVAALPLRAMYAIAALLAWLAYRVFPHRQEVVRENLSIAFPELDEAGLRDLMRRFYSSFAQVLVEIVKAVNWRSAQLKEHVEIANLELVRAPLAQGSPVLIVAAHQCNWEWFLLGLSSELGYPLAAAGESTAPGQLTERYARLVEAQIRASPPDWPWSHKRWRLKKSLYANR